MFLTSLVARLWTSWMALMFRLRCGFQTGAAYSRCGRTNVLNSCLNVAQFQVLNVRLSVASTVLAVLMHLLVCEFVVNDCELNR